MIFGQIVKRWKCWWVDISTRIGSTTWAKGTSWQRINQYLIILVAERPSILLIKTVVITSIVVRFTLRAAPKKKGLKKVVVNVIIRRRREGKKVVIISLIIFRFNAIVTRSPSPGYVALTGILSVIVSSYGIWVLPLIAFRHAQK